MPFSTEICKKKHRNNSWRPLGLWFRNEGFFFDLPSLIATPRFYTAGQCTVTFGMGGHMSFFWKVIEGMLETAYYWEDRFGKETKIEDLGIDFFKSIYACISSGKSLRTWRMQCL